jgi:RimJ/RimL family protein N-acetyltransferase
MATLRRARRFVLADDREVSVRSAVPADARPLRALLDAVAAEPSTPILHLPGGRSLRALRAEILEASGGTDRLLLVALVDGALAGHLALAGSGHPFARHVCEVGLAVAQPLRRVGVASALMDVALPWAARHSFTRVTAGVFPHNGAALAFFSRYGFRREGLRVGQYVRAGRVYDEVLLAMGPQAGSGAR